MEEQPRLLELAIQCLVLLGCGSVLGYRLCKAK